VIGKAAAMMVLAATVQQNIGGSITSCHHIWFDVVQSDEIWKEFGVTTWHNRHRRLRIVITGFLLQAAVTTGLWSSGALIPRSLWSADPHFAANDPDNNGGLSFRLLLEVENEGSVPFTVVGVSADIPGLRLLPPETRKEVTVAGSNIEVLRVRVAITDCAAIPHEPQPIRFTYRTWSGSRTAEAMVRSWQVNNLSRSVPIAWQRGLAVNICNAAMLPRQ
jgi:hypothetical protein